MADPVETPKRLYRKAERGKDEATPAILIGGVALVVGAAVAVLMTIALLIYFFA
jgi:hypothetical protein